MQSKYFWNEAKEERANLIDLGGFFSKQSFRRLEENSDSEKSERGPREEEKPAAERGPVRIQILSELERILNSPLNDNFISRFSLSLCSWGGEPQPEITFE